MRRRASRRSTRPVPLAVRGSVTPRSPLMVRMRRGGSMKRIVLLATVGVVVAAMLAASGLSVGNAQESVGQTDICAPWSKTWDLSEGQWYFTWYRWCYDPWVSDPWVEENWYIEEGDWEWG